MSDSPAYLDATFVFAKASLDLPGNDAAVLRYVAASTDCTRDEFIAAAKRAGYPRKAALNRYHEAMRINAEMDALDV